MSSILFARFALNEAGGRVDKYPWNTHAECFTGAGIR
jgi:hypothetical protein